MHKLKIYSTAVLFCGLALLPPVVSAQIMGPPLEAGVTEFGYIQKRFHRDMEPNHPREMQWKVTTLFARYAGYDWLTLSGEGLISDVKHDDFPGLRYQRFSLGGGVTSKLYGWRAWNLTGCLHYNEVFDRDHSANRFHKRTYGVIGGVQIGWSYGYRMLDANLWAGPMYVRDVAETYPWDANDPIKNESSGEFGFAAGAHVMLYRHAIGMVTVVYADYLQTRLGFAVSTGGER